MRRRGRLCFYSDYLFPVLVPMGIPFAGGAETQLAKFVRGLQERDFDVSVVTCDYGQPPHIRVADVDIYRSFPPRSGFPIARFVHPRLTGAIRGLRAADAEVYYVNGSGIAAGVTYDVARWRSAGYVNHIASDVDVVRDLPAARGARERWWYRRAIRGADLLLAQTEHQQRCLREEFGLASDVLPNLVEIPPTASNPAASGSVLWLGTYKSIKRPEWFTRLARGLPNRRFVMAGVVPPPPLTQADWDAAQAAGRDLPNLEVGGFVEHGRLAELFRDAALLVHTSPVEGFSNVLLEAWSYGVPTVSCVDPDGLISRLGLGRVVGEYAALESEVESRMADPEWRAEAGARARAYAIARHAPSVVFERLASLIDPVVERVRERRSREAGS